MKLKTNLLWGLTLVLLIAFNSCKPKESAYKAAYDAAKSRETAAPSQSDNTSVSTKPNPYAGATPVQREKVTVVDGSGLQQFSVVIGSFLDLTNARSLKERMTNQGFNSILAQNEKGMYRVIIASFNNKADAATKRDRIKDQFYPNFQDAWILDKQ